MCCDIILVLVEEGEAKQAAVLDGFFMDVVFKFSNRS